MDDLAKDIELLKVRLRDAQADKDMYRCYANEHKILWINEHNRAEMYKGLFISAALIMIAIAAVFTIYNYGG